MRDFAAECEDLAPLETFAPSVFVGDANASQQVCNFVLALALVYNDCKDIIYAHIILEQSKPSDPPSRSRAWGAWGGIEHHIFRLIVGMLHSLFELIQSNRSALDDSFLQSVIRQLRADHRDAWQTVVGVALDASPSDGLGRALMLVRNKIAFHYDPKCIFRGYQRHFLGEDPRDERAFISRGMNMAQSRFYFADAASIGYVGTAAAPEIDNELVRTTFDFLRPLNRALMQLVEGFIQRRGGRYRSTPEERRITIA
jgi:hypothetical protein